MKTQTKSQTDDTAVSEDVFQGRCAALLLGLPWLQAGVRLQWPLTDEAVKRACSFLGADVDDRVLEKYAARFPIGESGWRPSDLMGLAAYLNIRIQAPEGDQ